VNTDFPYFLYKISVLFLVIKLMIFLCPF